jgi:hypothetical protein
VKAEETFVHYFDKLLAQNSKGKVKCLERTYRAPFAKKASANQKRLRAPLLTIKRPIPGLERLRALKNSEVGRT